MGLGSWNQDPEKLIPDPGVKKAPDPGSAKLPARHPEGGGGGGEGHFWAEDKGEVLRTLIAI